LIKSNMPPKSNPNSGRKESTKTSRSAGSKAKPARGRQEGKSDAQAAEDYANSDDEELQEKPVLIIEKPPPNQLDLDAEQLAEPISRILTASDPNKAKDVTRFHYFRVDQPQGDGTGAPGPRPVTVVDGKWRKVERLDHMAVHFQMDGELILRDSDEGKEQEHMMKSRGLTAESFAKQYSSVGTSMASPTSGGGGGFAAASLPSLSNARPETAGSNSFAEGDAKDEEDRPLKNQFNYSERAAQTFNNPLRNRAVCTEPPPTADFEHNFSQSVMFDAYIEDLAKQLEAGENKTKKNYGGEKEENETAKEHLVQQLSDLETAETASSENVEEAQMLARREIMYKEIKGVLNDYI